ncbi:hypothetical protein GCM10009119_21730 [Algoriphagus jejuensis]|uniref:PKD/Chitinase domain-containing protein n=1 Tax=Algoriphagus jejuensis TaxID=419934 RepID=A0ABP3YCT4_9BACT
MQPLNSYPVFEADQVLSNGHLNNLLNYLEQQERLTRIKLVGRGIVCGLEITTSNTAITLSKGCGLTSQGYLIQLCETNFTHYTAYVPPVLPNDLYFLTQCSAENRDQIPYYGQKDILELIPEGDKDTTDKKLLNTLNQQDYAVVLFLETEQIDLKNCDTQDCNDKGSRMDFTLKTLLIHRKFILPAEKASFNTIFLKRFNVPVGDLKTSEDILQGFLTITDDGTLKGLSENLVLCWSKYAVMLGLPAANPLENLNLIEVKKKLSGNTGQRIFVQYFYDFVDDLLKAYLEFKCKVSDVFGECCPDEMDFPLHLTLGMASENTILGKRNSQRQYFEPSPIQGGLGKNADEAAALLERLVAMIKGFMGEKLAATEPIIITPSNLGHDNLSGRAIPYYYDWKSVNPRWHFSLSYDGSEQYNLGYRASQQSDAPGPVKNPLLYDIERYNAFRIEGHVGKNYQSALTEIIRQKHEFNLPFEVLALNAIDLSAILNGKQITCHIEDLTSDYRVMITGIVCQLQQILAYVGNLRPKRSLNSDRLVTVLNSKKDFYISKNLVDMQKTIKADIAKNRPISISNADIIKNLALRDVEEGEKLADFVAKDISQFIVEQKTFFDYIIKQPDLLLIFLQQLAEIVKYLLSFDLNQFDEDAYNKLWTPYSKTVASLIQEATKSENEEIKQYFSAKNTELLFKCANEKLFALKEEYLKRLAQYDAAINFNEYFKKHPGLEHKAGVTKGGSFVLVYNGVPERLLTLPDLVITNPNLDIVIRNTLANLAAKESAAKSVTMDKSALVTEISKKESLIEITAAKRTEFEFASDLIKNLNLGDAAKSVLDALNIKDKEIRDQATPISKGTVIADFYLPYLCCSDCPPIAYVIPEVIEPENKGPIANAGPDQTLTFVPGRGNTATLDGSASSDADGTIKSFAWTQVSGPAAAIKAPEKVKTTVQFESAGVHIFALKVTDDKGATAEDSVSVNVTEAENTGPQARAGEDQTLPFVSGRATTTVLDGSASSDADGTIKSFAWTQVSGPTAAIKTPEKVKTTVQFASAGVHVFALKVTDDKGATAEDSVSVNVTEAENTGPQARAGEDQTLPFVSGRATTAVLDGSASSDADGTIKSFAWTQVSGPTAAIKAPEKVKTTVQFESAGVHIFALKVTDDKGATAEDSVSVNVTEAENTGPQARAGEDQTLTFVSGRATTAVLDGSASSDADGTIKSFAWTQSSGPTAAIKTPEKVKTTVQFASAGVHVFALRVTDDKGATAEDSVTVNVSNNDRQKSCGPLQDIIKAFEEFDSTDSNDLFGRFVQIYSPYGQIKEFFAAMKVVANESPEKQIDFFVNEFVNTGLLSQFVEWLQLLNNLLIEIRELRTLAFGLYKILNLLAMHIVCIQKDDFDVASIPTQKVFEVIESHAKVWADMRASGAMGRLELQLILRVESDMSAAMVQTTANGEETIKTKYFSQLKIIVEIL